ncbi:unnamed protein product [Symbiodinium natans]|uniref:Dienelactone hydrolase domain-containing protein n=1 Tax=Symbiodinium natans TaxID=878477 RepID=A0A812SQ11_9DINO|nr:unnamed protein product [Symbiodinium natans]
MAYKPTVCTASMKCPAVVVIQDWNGMNDYEKERTRMLAGLGYVGFAADIYGYGTPVEDMSDWMAASSAHRGNPDLYMSKISAAIDKVKTYDFVDTSKIAVIGYCFGGTGVVNMAILGMDILGVVGYHSGIQPNARVVRGNSTVPVVAKVLLHSGVMDDAATDMALLEQELESAQATYEIDRYGSGVYHSFTEWSAAFPGQAMYDQRADVRSWESTKLFLAELFSGLPAASRGPEHDTVTTGLHNYTCNTTTCEGYMAYNASACTASMKCPAVVVIQDWNGMNDYEKERARMLAGLGYVGFAADIYGYGTPVEDMSDWMAASSAHRGNPDLYMSKISAAIDKVKTYDFVDTSKIAVIGYCFGGTGVVNMAILGMDILGVVGYHSGIQPNARVVRGNSTVPVVAKVLLHSGVMDDAATDMALLEQELESAQATYEIDRYGSGVYHSFTEWSAAFPGQAMYDQRADVRSWESTKLFLTELFSGLPAAAREPECDDDHDHDNQANSTQTSDAFYLAFPSLASLAALAVMAA